MPTNRTRLDQSGSKRDQVARNIRNAIEAGTLRDGEVLPSTRQLAEEWDVSVFTISEAMKLLAEEGLVLNKSRSMRVVQRPDEVFRVGARPKQPRVLIIGGYAGSGKTELGRILARETAWPILDKDTATRPVVEAALETHGLSPHDRESSTYIDLIRPREYEGLMAAATENVECGTSAIVTAPFLQEFADTAWIGRTRARFEGLGATTTLVWVRCDAATMQTYLRHRGAARDTAKLADWEGYIAGIDPDFRPDVPHFLVDNSTSSEPLQSQAKYLLKLALDGATP